MILNEVDFAWDFMEETQNNSRRSFFSKILSLFMAGGLLASYGAFFSMAARYLYPSKPRRKEWLFVTELKRMKIGDALSYKSPEGSKIAIARKGNAGGSGDFIALSSTCPHLGCQVHWEGPKDRFFCPCHNGAFNSEGKATEGPPAEAKQSLSRYPLKVDKGMLFIEVPLDRLGHNAPVQMPNMPTKHI